MKDSPILMCGAMVRTTLAGIKRQTRRIVKLNASGRAVYKGRNWHLEDPEVVLACPYGKIGDRLWVRENGWERPERTPKMMREGADTWAPYYFDADGYTDLQHDEFKEWGFKRRPSIHMPRWASRILLEITGVRVERLQAISVSDAIREGYDGSNPSPINPSIKWYADLWESINGPRSWDANPWVWVIEFKVAKP